MKIVKKLAILIGVFSTGHLYAQDIGPSKFFAGIELGVVQHTVDVSGVGTNYESESGNSFSPNLLVGYNFTESISIIAQYTDFGKADLFDTTFLFNPSTPVKVEFSTETTGFSLVGQYMSPREVGLWSFGARLGLIRWSTDFNSNFSAFQANFTDTKSETGVAFYGGLIGSYALSETWDITLGADWFVNDLDVEIIDGAKTDMQYSRLNLGLKYNW
jgi:opacity protein-like surface antigen